MITTLYYLIFGLNLVHLNLGICPRTPQIGGIPGPLAKTELGCALNCKNRHDCFAYLFKNLEDFLVGPNTFESNCMLETVFDRSFLTEQIQNENEYISKICIAPASSGPNVQNFIELPKVNVVDNAEKLGFSHVVNFSNFSRFYKILSYEKDNWKTFRNCAKHGGIVAAPYDTSQAKVIHVDLSKCTNIIKVMFQAIFESMENETKGFEIGSLLQKSFENELLTTYLSTGKQGFDDNYKVINGDCDQYEQSFKHYSTYAYNADKDKFVISTDIRNYIKNFYCEFTGSENYVAISQVEATNEYNHLYGLKYLHDQVWGETSFRGHPYYAYVSKTKNAMVLFTLPTKIALRMVVMLPRLQIGGDVQNLKVLVSDERPSKILKITSVQLTLIKFDFRC